MNVSTRRVGVTHAPEVTPVKLANVGSPAHLRDKDSCTAGSEAGKPVHMFDENDSDLRGGIIRWALPKRS